MIDTESTDKRPKLLILGCVIAIGLLIAVWWNLSREYLGAVPKHGYDLTPAVYKQPEPTGPLVEVAIPKLVIGAEPSAVVELLFPDKLAAGSRLELVGELTIPKKVRGVLLSVSFLAPVDVTEGRSSYSGVNQPWSPKNGPALRIKVGVPSQKGRYLVEIETLSTEMQPNERKVASGIVVVE